MRIDPSRAAIVIIVIIGLALFARFEQRLLAYPYDWEETEGDHLNYALLISEGTSPYVDNDRLPMLFMLYPPFFHVILAGLVKAFGPHVVLGRLISLASIAAIAVLVWAIVRRRTSDEAIALVAAGSVFTAKIFMEALAVGRINALYIALVLAGYYCVSVARSRPLLTVASVLFFLAVYTKQVALIPILLCYAYLALKDLKEAIGQLLVFGALCATALLALQWASGGWFVNNILSIPAGQANYGVKYIVRMLAELTARFLPLMLLALVALKRGIAKRRIDPFMVYLLSGALIILAFGWNSGATADYMFPAAIGLVIIGASEYKRLQRPALSAAIAAFFLIQVLLYSNAGDYHLPPRASDAAAAVRALEGIDGPVLTERMSTIPILAGKEVLIEASVVDLLYGSNVWSPEELERSIRERRFAGILAKSENPFNVPRVSTMIDEGYERTQTFDLVTRGTVHTTYALYEPKAS